MITATVDASGLGELLVDLQSALIGQGQSGDMRVILKDEARLLFGTIIKFTPPPNLAHGRAKTRGDINRLFRPAPTKKEVLEAGEGNRTTPPAILVNNPKALARLTSYVDAGDVRKIRVMLGRMRLIQAGEAVNNMTQEQLAQHHHRNRDADGRVRRIPAGGKLTILRGLSKYITSQTKRVGRMRAGWGPAFLALGGKLPSWVQRHMSQNPPGTCTNMLELVNDPWLLAENHAGGVRRKTEKDVNNAIAQRGKSIVLKTKLAISGYAEDVARGIKVKRRAQLRSPVSVE